MTNSEQAIREFAEKWCLRVIECMKDDDYIMHDPEGILSDLTALIEEHYYPKEFVGWLLNGYTFLKRDQSFVVNYPYLTEHNDYRHFTTDELFNYWEENER